MKEDIDFLQRWLELGNKWREIANIIVGRTESQVKNRFKLILRREAQSFPKKDAKSLKEIVIPSIIAVLQKKVLEGNENVHITETEIDQGDSIDG